MNAPTKDQIVTLLYAWISQRPGLEFGDYGDVANYRSEVRRIGRQLADARLLLRQVELSGITADELAQAFPSAYSGRLSLAQRYRVNGKGRTFATLDQAKQRAAEYLPAIVAIESLWAIDYCTGQYWPTEYRAAACAVLASALWAYKRDKCMPEPKEIMVAGTAELAYRAPGGYLRAGDWLRSSFRRDFGRSIQSRYFD